ncbi:MAG TPA: UDP-N-acetylglucosamine 2-epimerase (non-hydrolyzing) [Victivallales bacterium]|nr:UDP-N-acetylglucosamine 2-epimerase (non-hydrolyzing) [Victivallales bacterium]HRR28411.1 UDP-N-acetylglucosamine 2-epimerase (non-hydrolyzing) [Victivallales bacterium]HRU01591.1 UDP-N-acetylglucosamine 2-epimerase (non-hydrolyzing) [Victivallales bacterium]
MKILTIIGARPQFIKAAALSAKIAELQKKANNIEEIIVHTGQHYDTEMSDVFFKELHIPREKYNLKVGSASHAIQTAKIMSKLENIIETEKPDFTLLYGDTNSTLAGAITAAKLKIKIAHIEAGLRSFNKNMPEEINRIVTDHLSSLNFCPTKTALENLRKEGLAKTARLVGDIMYDIALIFTKISENFSNKILNKFKLQKKNFILMTCHRAENTDDLKNLKEIISAANQLSQNLPIIFPIHPRTKKIIIKNRITLSKNIILSKPLSYIQSITLQKNAKILLTDSGGMQKEAFFFNTPCITFRNETEWVETVKTGMNIVTGANSKKIIDAFAIFAKKKLKKFKSHIYGDGNTAEKILKILNEYSGK